MRPNWGVARRSRKQKGEKEISNRRRKHGVNEEKRGKGNPTTGQNVLSTEKGERGGAELGRGGKRVFPTGHSVGGGDGHEKDERWCALRDEGKGTQKIRASLRPGKVEEE